MLLFGNLVDLLVRVGDDGESHVERNPHVFHPSQLGNTCIRQVYLQKLGLETKPYPAAADSDDTVTFDETHFRRLLARAWRVREVITTHGIATTPAEISFPRCGCWKCEREAEPLALPDEPLPLDPAPEPDPLPAPADPTPVDGPTE